MSQRLSDASPEPLPVVAVPADTRSFDGYRWHAVPAQYLSALAEVSGAVPLVVPALGERALDAVMDRVDGVMLTGSRSNIHPRHYEVAPTQAHEPFDEARDDTALPLILRTLERGLPLFAICRGMQELNVALGGTVGAEIQDRPDRMDHRAPDSDEPDERFALSHTATASPGGVLAAIVGTAPVRVNSLHRQAIDRLAAQLRIEATAEDGTIEAVSAPGATGFALGVQWHPEYWAESDDVSRCLFEAFGRALRGQPAVARATG